MLAVRVQFYFDRFIPSDDSWPAEFGIQLPTRRIVVAARRRVDPLFPESVDESMAEMTFSLAPLSRPGGELTTRVRDRVIDRLGVTVIDDALTPGPMEVAEQLIDEFLDTAVRTADAVIGHCRVLAGAPMLRGVQREYHAQDDRFYVMDPHTVSWFAGDDPTSLAPLAVYQGGATSQASSGAIRSPESGTVPFHALQRSLAGGPEPNTPDALLISAEERLTQMFLREAVVALATAVEVASDAFIHRHNAAQRVDDILRSRASFARKRLHRVPHRLLAVSLRSDDERCYDNLEVAYRVRNQIAHAGRLEASDRFGHPVEIGPREVRAFIESARKAVVWLNALDLSGTAT